MAQLQLKCQYNTHNNEDIIAVCVNKECNLPRLCCLNCINEGNHDQHRRQILEFPQFNLWKQLGIEILDQFKQIIYEQENLIQILKQVVIDNQEIGFQNEKYMTASMIEKSIKQIHGLNELSSKIETDLQDLNYSTNQIIKKSKLYYTDPLIDLHSNFQQNKAIFSRKQSHPLINISQDGRVAEFSGKSYLYVFCLCDPILLKNCGTTFAVRYIKGGVSLGICKKDIYIECNYQPDLSKSDHGQENLPDIRFYLISDAGSTYSGFHTNQKQKTFKFYYYDVIIVRVDLSSKTIIWMKQKTGEAFAMYLDESDSDYYPCIGLIGMFDSKVQILDSF